MRKLLVVLLLLLPLVATDAKALNISGTRVIVPVIGRFPGAGGTQWRTDVFIANPGSPTYQLTLRFYPTGQPVQVRTITITPFSVLTLTDICLNTFGLANTGGVLEVDAGVYTTQVRARIYNVGNPAGQFGQGVPGIGYGNLGRQAYLYGLSTIGGNRVNIGVANPNDVAIVVNIYVNNHLNTQLATRAVTVQPHQYVQYNDIVVALGIAPQEGLIVNMISDQLLYGFASEVRNDTGDAVFTFGVSPNV
jgi:hypothetical protein